MYLPPSLFFYITSYKFKYCCFPSVQIKLYHIILIIIIVAIPPRAIHKQESVATCVGGIYMYIVINQSLPANPHPSLSPRSPPPMHRVVLSNIDTHTNPSYRLLLCVRPLESKDVASPAVAPVAPAPAHRTIPVRGAPGLDPGVALLPRQHRDEGALSLEAREEAGR